MNVTISYINLDVKQHPTLCLTYSKTICSSLAFYHKPFICIGLEFSYKKCVTLLQSVSEAFYPFTFSYLLNIYRLIFIMFLNICRCCAMLGRIISAFRKKNYLRIAWNNYYCLKTYEVSWGSPAQCVICTYWPLCFRLLTLLHIDIGVYPLLHALVWKSFLLV